MNSKEKFSERFGFEEIKTSEIKIRHDVPFELRRALPLIVKEFGLSPKPFRKLICEALLISPDPSNWSEYPNIENEVIEHLENCEWYEIYDIIEKVYDYLYKRNYEQAAKYEEKINKYFYKQGIGWKLSNGFLEMRGPETFEHAVKNAVETLEEKDIKTARKEIEEALHDISKRPKPDITGAIQHSMAALECVAREITDSSDTLGSIIKKNRHLFPAPLDNTVEKLWGFASEYGRHLTDGREPSFEDAELIVSLCASLSNYLTKKFK